MNDKKENISENISLKYLVTLTSDAHISIALATDSFKNAVRLAQALLKMESIKIVSVSNTLTGGVSTFIAPVQ